MQLKDLKVSSAGLRYKKKIRKEIEVYFVQSFYTLTKEYNHEPI